ncbi:MAG: zf-HC2 domain-containing protein [Anaerolineales bacterium]
MHEDMRALLNAYLDGELRGWRLLEMQNHLASCDSCRSQLRQLRAVSDLLRAAPRPAFTPAERFAANLALRLPRRPLKAQLQRGPSLAWWLAPLALIGAWFFLQTLLWLTAALSLALDTGMLGEPFAWLSSGAAQSNVFAFLMNLLGSNLDAGAQSTLSFIDRLALFGNGLLNQWFWQAIIALLYWVWMAIWWLRTRGRAFLPRLARA